jgi:hypothetical protein
MIAGALVISDQDTRSTSTSLGGEYIGQIAKTADGRTWRYGQNGSTSTALSPGKLAQFDFSGAVKANHLNRTGTTQVAGDLSVTFAVGATAVAADQYRGGYLVVNAGTGAGQNLLIRGNTKAGSSGSPVVYLKDAIITATSVTDSKFSLVPNIYSAALIAASGSPTAVVPLGVPTVSIAASAAAFPGGTNGWFQVGGPAAVLANGTPASGGSVIPSATTDGAVDVDGASSVQPKVGYMINTGVSGEYRQVFLTVNPE